MFNWSKITALTMLLFCIQLAFLNADEIRSNFSQKYDLGTLIQKDKTYMESLSSNETIVNPKSQLYIVGDIMLGRDVERKIKIQGTDYPYKKIFFDAKNSFVLANFESAIPEEHIPTPNNTFRFSVDPDFLPSLSKAGFTHLSLANNHAFDYGLHGYNHTIDTLWNNKFVPFGHPSVLSTSSVALLQIEDLKVSIVAMHTLFNQPDLKTISEVVSYANSISDMQIVYIHWGEEYNENQSTSQREFATSLSELGIDLIVGHHPHVVQGIEKINDTLVFYSLGNYIFDQYFSTSVETGLMLKLTSFDNLKIELIPVSSAQNRAQPEEMAQENKQAFLQKLSLLSDSDLVEQVNSGSFTISTKLASSTEVAIMKE